MDDVDAVYVRYLNVNRIAAEAEGINRVDSHVRRARTRKNFLLPHDVTALATRLEKQHSMAMVAVNAAGEVKGYALYLPLKDGMIELLKLEIEPAYEGRGLREYLLDAMQEKLGEGCASKLVAHVHIDDVDMQKALKQAGYKAPKGQAIKPKYFADGGAAVRLEASILPPELQASAPEPGEPKNRKELLQEMLKQLEAMTGLEWEAALPDASGALKAAEVTHMSASNPELYLRTQQPVRQVGKATLAIGNYFGLRPVGALASINKSGHVAVRASNVRMSSLRSGMEGMFTSVFAQAEDAVKPADNFLNEGRWMRG